MKKSYNKITALLLTSLVLSSMFVGCKKEDTTKTSINGEAKVSSFAGYPMSGSKKLKIWSSVSYLQKEFTSKEQSPFLTSLEKNTGVSIDWTFVPSGTDTNQAFNLLIASGDLPDIIYHGWGGVSGGPDSYIKDKYIISLNDILPKYAPNLSKYLSEHKDIDKAVKTDAGTYYDYPWLRGDQWLTVFRGPAARKDWMDELGIKTPETMDDWDKMLRAFNAKNGSVFSFPEGWANEAFIGAYGAVRGYYQDNGKVKYGMTDQAYKDYLTQMNKWYKDGLLDKDFATIDANGLQTKVLNGKVGAMMTSGGTMTSYDPKLKAIDAKGEIVGLPYPVLKKGDKVKFSQMDPIYNGGGAAITTACKDVETAARFLDYCYSDKGLMFMNFGTEGVSYTMVNGTPTFTDALTKYSDGISSAMDKYIGTQWSVFSIQDKRMYLQKTSKAAVAAIDLWSSNTDMPKNMLSSITPTVEESQEMSKLGNAIDTYAKEMYFKFIMGSESLDKYDDYMANLKKLNIDRVLQLKQTQLDRYNRR